MAYTAQTLITRSWYLSGIVARNLQAVTGDQITDGLLLLNSLLDFKQIETDLIPYFTYNTSISCIAGQETYFVPNCALIQSITFNYSNVRYPMQYLTEGQYFGAARVNNVSSLPFNWTYVRELGGGNLYLYFLPNSNYQLNIYGKFFLQDVSLQTDLLSVYDTSYIEYLRYALAELMCSEYGIQFNPESAKKLMSYQRKLMYLSPPDLGMKKLSILQESSGLNYGDVNIGLGFRPT